MPNKSALPREYKTLSISNTAVITPTKYFSKPDGFISEYADFTELDYFLGFKFEPRTFYTINSPEGVSRGGHLEGRTKLSTVTSGLVYCCLVDTRPGEDQGKVEEFYLGEGKDSQGTSMIVPEGVIDYFVPVGGSATIVVIGDRPYNKFDNLLTLDINDPSLGLHPPKNVIHHVPLKEEVSLLTLAEFLAKL
jgi:dTDP-4-dehydrorhamnose 3,5-epimerase-like enzyme